jgi:hypothetical protein
MMVEDAGETEMSLALWFKCLDVGSDGRLDWHGLSFFFEAKVDELLREGHLEEKQPSFEAIRAQSQSIVPELGCPGGASLPQVRLRRATRALLDLFCFVDVKKQAMEWVRLRRGRVV